MNKVKLETAVVIIVWVVMLVLARASEAKEPIPLIPVPATVPARVMREFSQLVGSPVTVGDIGKYLAAINTTSPKECPASQYKVGRGYIMTFQYHGITFDYRVDLSVTHVVLCSMQVQ